MALTPLDSGGVPSASSQQWSPENDQTVNNHIQEALNHSHGNVEEAFAYLRDKRDIPSNYYDTNLAIAADYLRARWDTQRHGPDAEDVAIGIYMAAKQFGAVPKEGPGPVSPYSEKEQEYMLKGVQDEARNMSSREVAAWNVSLPAVPAITIGDVEAILDNLPNPKNLG